MYDPQLMRFTSIDPAKGKPHWPLSMHPFLYCGSEPINRIDPKGTTYTIVDPIIAGYAVHFHGIATAAYGVSSGNLKFLDLGIEINKFVAPAMMLAMVSSYGSRPLPESWNDRMLFKHGWNPKWPFGKGKWAVVIATGWAIAMLVDNCDMEFTAEDFEGLSNWENQLWENPPNSSGP